jgi:predicted metal-dependent hydrolase
MAGRRMTKSESSQVINLAGRDVPVRIRRNKRARRIILRVDSNTDGAVVTLPSRASEMEALLLVQEKSDWLLARLNDLPAKISFQDGAHIPLLGQNYVLRHDPDLKGVAQKEDNIIRLGGRPEHFARRLTDWLKKQAKAEIQTRTSEFAGQIDCKFGRITVRDTRSRWGSCSPNGNLSFCWRLILTPDWVLSYVVAHEVSHLRHMDHSPAFWQTVDSLGVQVEEARRWLNDNAEQLQRYG